MPVTFELSKAVPAGASAVGVAVPADRVGEIDLPWAFLRAQGFEGKADQVAVMPGDDGPRHHRGRRRRCRPRSTPPPCGGPPRASCERDAAARTIASRLHESWPESVPAVDVARAFADGASVALYRFDRYKTTGNEDLVERVVWIGTGGQKVRDALASGARIAEGVALARDLVNTPGGELTPAMLAATAKEIAETENLKLTILKEKDIERARLGGLLGVNRGSTHPPRFIELEYEPTNARGSLALVGKGITFDSGGLSLKTADGMMTMKDDMGGAAAILGAFSTMSSVAPRCRVRGYIPATDNMPAGDATRPGDVLKIRNGKTVEVLNTDAEGRLVLADALSLASEAQPDAILDLATLTGAVEVALGSGIAGLMGNDDAWTEQVRAAATQAGERVWELPLPDDYRKVLDSDVADLRNVSKTRGAGSIVAGLFLREFVAPGIPWAHLDIAGTAWSADGADADLSVGGTGWGVRTILELASTFRPG